MFVWRVPEQQEGSETLDSGNTVSQKKHDRKINLHNERTRPLTTPTNGNQEAAFPLGAIHPPSTRRKAPEVLHFPLDRV